MALVRVVVDFFHLPQGYLASTYLTVGVRRRIILNCLGTILPVHPIEVILEATSGERRPRTPGEGALALFSVTGKSYLVDLGEVFMLA